MSYMPSYYIRVTRLTFINTEHTERYFNFQNSYKWVINLGTDLPEWFCRGNIGGFCHRGNRPQRCLLLSGTLMVKSEMLIKYVWVGYWQKISLNTTTIRKIRSMKTLILKPNKKILHNLNTKNRNTTWRYHNAW